MRVELRLDYILLTAETKLEADILWEFTKRDVFIKNVYHSVDIAGSQFEVALKPEPEETKEI